MNTISRQPNDTIEIAEHNKCKVEALDRALTEHKRVAYISATGTGKSYVAAQCVVMRGLEKETLILSPSDSIRNDWFDMLPYAQFGMYQTLKKADLNGVKCIIADEFHHLGSDIWGSDYVNLVKDFDGLIIGLTATELRYLDGCRNMADELFSGNVIHGYTLGEAINNNILPSIDYYVGLFSMPSELGKLRNETTEKLFKKLDLIRSVDNVQSILTRDFKGKKTIVFVSRVEDIPIYMHMVNGLFPNTDHYIMNSTLSRVTNITAKYNFMHTKNNAFLYVIDMINEGAHIKNVDSIIFFRRTVSPAVWQQQLGRGLAAAKESGTRIQVFDFVANIANTKYDISRGDSHINTTSTDTSTTSTDTSTTSTDTYKKYNNNTCGETDTNTIREKASEIVENDGYVYTRIEDINKDIKHKEYQIIVNDKLKDTLHIINKINDLTYGLKWTADEVLFLLNNFEEKGTNYVSEKLNRSPNAVRAKAATFNLTKLTEAQKLVKNKYFLSLVDEYVQGNYTAADISELVGKDRQSKFVLQALKILGVPIRPNGKAVIKHKDIIIDPNTTPRQVLEKLKSIGFTEYSLSKITTIRARNNGTKKRNIFTDKDIEYINVNKNTKSLKEIAKDLGKPISSVKKVAISNNIDIKTNFYTDDEMKILMSNLDKPISELARLLPNRSRDSISHKRKSLLKSK